LSLSGWAVLAAYAGANAVASVAATRGRRRLLPLVPLAYLTPQLAYGIGFLAGLVRFRRGWPPGAFRMMVAALRGRATT
jgi:hypothetical protein